MPTPRGTPSPLYLPPCPCPWVFRGFCVPGFTLSLLTCHVSCTGINKYYFRLLYSLIMSCHVWRAKTPLAPSGILLPFPDRLPHLLPFVPFPAVAFRAISCRLGLSCYTCPRSPLCDMLPGKYNKPLPVDNARGSILQDIPPRLPKSPRFAVCFAPCCVFRFSVSVSLPFGFSFHFGQFCPHNMPRALPL